MILLLAVLVVTAGVVLLMRAAAAANGGGSISPPRPPRAPRPRPEPRRFVAPDDDPQFLRELDRRRSAGEGPGA